MVRVTETCVLETRVVNCPHLIEQVKCDLCCPYRLLLRVYQIFNTEEIGFVEVHDGNVVEAAEDIVLDFVFHEGDAGGEGVVPGEMEIIDDGSEILVPVEVFGESECVLGVHFDGGNVLIEDVHGDIGGEFETADFVSELVDFGKVVSEGHGDLGGLAEFKVFGYGFDEVGGVGLFEGIAQFHWGKDCNIYKYVGSDFEIN